MVLKWLRTKNGNTQMYSINLPYWTGYSKIRKSPPACPAYPIISYPLGARLLRQGRPNFRYINHTSGQSHMSTNELWIKSSWEVANQTVYVIYTSKRLACKTKKYSA